MPQPHRGSAPVQDKQHQADARSLSVGVVTFGSGTGVVRSLLDSLVEALGRASEELDLRASVHVVCNDESAEQVRAMAALVDEFADAGPLPMRCRLIAGQGNIGYGAAQNLAIRRSSAEFHLVLNPDVVLDAHALVESVRFLEAHPSAVMAAPRGFDADGAYAGLAKREPSVLVLLLRALSVPPSTGPLGSRVGRYVYNDCLPSGEPLRVHLASGCYMFCRTSALQDVGGFDERYFLYFEDYDLCRRIAVHGGIHEVPGVKIRHQGGHTARRGPRRIARFVRSGIRYFNTYGWRIL